MRGRRAQGAGDVQPAVEPFGQALGEGGHGRGRLDGVDRDVPDGGGEPGAQRRLHVRAAVGGRQRPQGHQRMRRETGPHPLVLQHVRRLPRVHRDQDPPGVAHLLRPVAGDQALLGPYGDQAQLHHGPVLGCVRQLLGDREAGPGAAVGVVRMAVDDALLPLPGGACRTVLPGGRLPGAGEREGGRTGVQLGGEVLPVRDPQGPDELSGIPVGPAVEQQLVHVRPRRVRVRRRALQPAAPRQHQRETTGRRLAAHDPRQGLEGQGPPQPGEHGRPGAAQRGGVRGPERGPYGGQFGGDGFFGRGGGNGHAGLRLRKCRFECHFECRFTG